ncbi:unnamed protein product [Cylindrotheca closterium]|uniref:Uncharacterized protein n=1 Tax=Cylindrotheca closterium TaxID=2856 RepID=A0AAD2FIE8_9STRA|nr:unnamed protein product [Cylindrotheca closterium]
MTKMESAQQTGAENSARTKIGNAINSVGPVAFGIGQKISWLQEYPGTIAFRAMVKNSFDAYGEASQEGRDEIVRGIVNQFPPDVTIEKNEALRKEKQDAENIPTLSESGITNLSQ